MYMVYSWISKLFNGLIIMILYIFIDNDKILCTAIVTVCSLGFFLMLEGARWCSGSSSHLQPLRPLVQILGRALHVGKLVVTC